MLPLDGDFDVDAEYAGAQGEFGGEGEQCGGAVFAGLEADLLKALAEPVF